MTMLKTFTEWTLEDFAKYNEDYDAGKFRGSEAEKYDLEAIKKWISIRDDLRYTDNTDGNSWQELCIIQPQTRTKYGCAYLYIDLKRKLWRFIQDGSEFYGHHWPKLDI